MKPVILYAFLIVFVANTTVVSAWAKSCMLNAGSSPEQTDVSMSDDIPCHGEHGYNEQNHEQNHKCEDLCLCLNVLVSQTPIIFVSSLHFPAMKATSYLISKVTVASIATSPLFRPPIILS